MENNLLKCNTCNQFLETTCFNRANKTKRGFQIERRTCQKKRNSQWQKDNKQKVNTKTKRWQENHREDYLAQRRFLKTGNSDLKVFKLNPDTNTKKCSCCKKECDISEYYLSNDGKPYGKCFSCRRKQYLEKRKNLYFVEEERKRFREINKKKRSTPQGRIDSRLSNAIWYALKQQKSFRSWEDLVGYTAGELKVHLENLFSDGMTWDLFLMGEIHIDHRIPKSWFKYSCAEDDDFKKCWSLDNLQPKWKIDNLRKNARYFD